MRRMLSAPSLRGLFLARAIGGLVGAAVALYVLGRLQAASGGRPVLFAIGVAIVAIVAALLVKDQLTRRTLKCVAVDERFLYVSDYGDSYGGHRSSGAEMPEEAIPVENIVRVTQWRGRTFRPVTIYLRSASTFGTRIRFQPKPEWGLAIAENTVVAELKALARLD